MRWLSAILKVVLLLAATLRAAPSKSKLVFADVFASVLVEENPDGGTWSEPGTYLDAAAAAVAPSRSEIERALKKPIDKYRVLIVPGFMSACSLSSSITAGAFHQALEHLKTAHGMDAVLMQVPDDSSENNGKLIAKYLLEHAGSGKKFIVVGHSKGAVDLQLALQDRAAANEVAALVSVAGAVGGSPLADLAEGRGLLANLEVPMACAGKVGRALESLRTDQRRQFLAGHPSAPVPSYSLVAASGFSNTSRILLPTWGLLGAAFLGKEDGLLLAADGTLPGGKLLGTALADHVAIAHDFQQTGMAKLYDKNQFPRTAMLEALIRFVEADLDK